MQIVDPAEETFPIPGRVEFIEPEGGRLDHRRPRRGLEGRLRARVARHRAEIRAETDKLGWSFAIHRTDRPAAELLLALHARMGAPPPGRGGEQPPARRRTSREARMIPWLPLGLRSRWCCSGCSACRCCGGCCALIPPQPRRIDFPPTRLLFDITPKEEAPRAHAVVAHAAAADARRARHHRRRRPAVESAGRDLDRQGAARAC